MGMGLSYAGTYNEWIRDKLTSILRDTNSPLDVTVFAAISLGLVFLGTCNLLVAQELVLVLHGQILVCTTWEDPLTRLLPLSLGLIYLGKQECVDEYDSVSSRFDVNIKKYCNMTLLSCAYAGTGNILKVQQFMGQCNGQLEEDGEYLGPAIVGIAMMAMAEKVGLEMSMRLLHCLLQHGGPKIRMAVPLALALLYISDPMVRIAQGLLYMGKGLLSLAPYHSDRFLLCLVARVSEYGSYHPRGISLCYILPSFGNAAKNADDCGRKPETSVGSSSGGPSD